MKLIRAKVRNFRSVEDSTDIEISGLTCLVGKNEAGKTAILDALRGLKPFRPFKYDRVRDYPRRYLSRYDERHPNGESEVIRTWWKLDDDDVSAVVKLLGPDTVKTKVFEASSGIGYDKNYWDLKIDEKRCLENFYDKHKLDAIARSTLKGVETTRGAVTLIEKLETKPEKLTAILNEIKAFRDSSAVLAAIDALSERMPKFFYTSHFERMAGEISLTKLAQDKNQTKVEIGDQIFLDFLEYAGTSIDELQKTKKYEELKAQCEGASNDITDEIFQLEPKRGSVGKN